MNKGLTDLEKADWTSLSYEEKNKQAVPDQEGRKGQLVQEGNATVKLDLRKGMYEYGLLCMGFDE